MKKVIYTAVFVDNMTIANKLSKTGVSRNILAKEIKNTHVTFKYMPKTVDMSLFGEKVTIRVVGYGCNGKNEGLKVQIITDNPAIQSLANEISVPHITLSIGENEKAVNTRDVCFHPITPFTICGEYNAFYGDQKK